MCRGESYNQAGLHVISSVSSGIEVVGSPGIVSNEENTFEAGEMTEQWCVDREV